MDEKKYIDSIFEQYAPTKELLELKEEISINLHENITEHLRAGLSKQEAFLKAKEDLGDVEQILVGFRKKENNIWKLIYYILSLSMVVGFFVVIITFFSQIGWEGAFLALGCMYPFFVIQPAYVLWYKMKKNQNMGWRNFTGITLVFLLFFVINILESLVREKYYFGSIQQGLENASFEIVLAIFLLCITIYAWNKNKMNEK